MESIFLTYSELLHGVAEVHCMLEVAVAATDWNSDPAMHEVMAEHCLLEVVVLAVDSYCAASQTVSSAHCRLDMVVGAALSYSQALLQVDIAAHCGWLDAS
jgi:hypothetical protein